MQSRGIVFRYFTCLASETIGKPVPTRRFVVKNICRIPTSIEAEFLQFIVFGIGITIVCQRTIVEIFRGYIGQLKNCAGIVPKATNLTNGN